MKQYRELIKETAYWSLIYARRVDALALEGGGGGGRNICPRRLHPLKPSMTVQILHLDYFTNYTRYKKLFYCY